MRSSSKRNFHVSNQCLFAPLSACFIGFDAEFFDVLAELRLDAPTNVVARLNQFAPLHSIWTNNKAPPRGGAAGAGLADFRLANRAIAPG